MTDQRPEQSIDEWAEELALVAIEAARDCQENEMIVLYTKTWAKRTRLIETLSTKYQGLYADRVKVTAVN